MKSLNEISGLMSIGSLIGMIVLGFLFFETRYEYKGESVKARLEAQVFAINLTIARLAGVKTLYDAREQIEGDLSPADENRRAQVLLELDNMTTRSDQLQRQLLELER